MAFFGVTVEKISKILPHTNADRLELGQVEGMSFQFVVLKGQFSPGSKVLYFPIDALLPLPVLEKLNLVGKLSGKEQNRVKTLRLRGEISQGIVAAVELFLTPEQANLSPEEITALLGVTKYEPPVQMTATGLLTALPSGYSVYDIEGADRYQEVVESMMDMDVVVMEKMEGTNFSAGKSSEGLFVNQRNNTIIEIPEEANTYWEVARNTGLVNFLKQSPAADLAVYAEFCGPKTQGNYYQLKNHTLYIFDIRENFKWVSWEQVERQIQGLTIQTAPVLFKGKLRDFLNGRTVQEASNGPSAINPNKLREGIVIKPLSEEGRHPKVGRLIIKQRSPHFLAGSEF